MNKFIWKSPLCQVNSVEIRKIQKTKKQYAVLKAVIVAMNYANRKEERTFKGRETTLMCFKETLLPVFKTDCTYVFEGEVSFAWGNTYHNITKVYLESGERLLKGEQRDGDCPVDDGCDVCPWDGKCRKQPLSTSERCAKEAVEEQEEECFTKGILFNDTRIPW